MRKFSTFHGLFTKTPVSVPLKGTPPPPTDENFLSQNTPEVIPPRTPTLSTKAVQCYKSLHDHDEAVRNLLHQSKPH